MSLFVLKVVTPEGEKYNREVESIVFRSTDGEVGILANHADYISPVDVCKLTIKEENGKIKEALCGGGFMTFSNNKACFVCDSLVFGYDIDKEALRTELESEKARYEASDDFRERAILKSSIKRLEYQMQIIEKK